MNDKRVDDAHRSESHKVSDKDREAQLREKKPPKDFPPIEEKRRKPIETEREASKHSIFKEPLREERVAQKHETEHEKSKEEDSSEEPKSEEKPRSLLSSPLEIRRRQQKHEEKYHVPERSPEKRTEKESGNGKSKRAHEKKGDAEDVEDITPVMPLFFKKKASDEKTEKIEVEKAGEEEDLGLKETLFDLAAKTFRKESSSSKKEEQKEENINPQPQLGIFSSNIPAPFTSDIIHLEGVIASRRVEDISDAFMNLVASIYSSVDMKQTDVLLKNGTMIHIDNQNGVLNITMTTDDSALQQAILSNAASITESLRLKKIEVRSINVSLSSRQASYPKISPIEEKDKE